MKNKMKKNMLINISIKIINFYQKTISPDHSKIWKSFYAGWYCKYYPTCSEYAKKSLQKHWFFKGLFMSTKRVIKCNPFAKWWIDNP